MSSLLTVGMQFESIEAFQAAMEQYEDANFVQLCKVDSRTVQKSQMMAQNKKFNPRIKYTQLFYACTFGPRKTSRSTGRRLKNSRKIDCPVRLRLSATSDGQRLIIKECKLDGHNHEISEERYRSLSRQRQLDEETELEIYHLISSHQDKRSARQLVRNKLTKETGKRISMKDILNIEKKVSKKLQSDQRLNRNHEGNYTESDSRESEEDAFESEKNDEDETEKEKAAELKNEYAVEAKKTEQIKPGEDKLTATMMEGISGQKSDSRSRIKLTAPPSRPQRNRREPSRFRDSHDPEAKVSHPVNDLMVFIHDESDSQESLLIHPKKSMDSTEKEELQVKGRKRKVEGASELFDTEPTQEKSVSIEGASEPIDTEPTLEKRVSIEETLVAMESKKIKLLEEIVKKLDRIIQNQEHR